MKNTKEIKKQKRKDLQFIISAITFELKEIAYNDYFDTWENSGGMQWFFDECVDLAKKVMFSDGSKYLEWLSYWAFTNDEYPKTFTDMFGVCFDWYHMDLARKEFESRYNKDEPKLPIQRNEVELIINLLKKIDVDGETMEHIITNVGMEEQIFRQLSNKFFVKMSENCFR